MDLSAGGNLTKIRREIIKESPLPVGTVPIYQAAVETAKKARWYHVTTLSNRESVTSTASVAKAIRNVPRYIFIILEGDIDKLRFIVEEILLYYSHPIGIGIGIGIDLGLVTENLNGTLYHLSRSASDFPYPLDYEHKSVSEIQG